jgi:hypothetical protein
MPSGSRNLQGWKGSAGCPRFSFAGGKRRKSRKPAPPSPAHTAQHRQRESRPTSSATPHLLRMPSARLGLTPRVGPVNRDLPPFTLFYQVFSLISLPNTQVFSLISLPNTHNQQDLSLDKVGMKFRAARYNRTMSQKARPHRNGLFHLQTGFLFPDNCLSNAAFAGNARFSNDLLSNTSRPHGRLSGKNTPVCLRDGRHATDIFSIT